MMEKIVILWPNYEPPDIYEMQYAYEFCREQSEALCQSLRRQTKWVYYAESDDVNCIAGNLTGSEDIMLVTDPLVILNERAVGILIDTLKGGYDACGPVYNDSQYGHQQAILDGLYHNISSYLEVASQYSSGSDPCVTADELDPGCILFPKEMFNKINFDILVKDIHRHIVGTKGVATAAMLHRFNSGAFFSAREDLIELIPESVTRVLDVGTARGGYGRRLKEIKPNIFIAGIEINPLLAQAAKPYYDEIFNSSIESFELPYQVDLINCGELLEHLDDPWKTLRLLSEMVTENGYLTLSVPNAGHWSILLDLVRGRFQYIPWGLQCVTHLRWFTEFELEKALNGAGFEIDILNRVKFKPTPAGERFINDLLEKGYGSREQLTTAEIIVRARKE